jgi:hypothetical protein
MSRPQENFKFNFIKNYDVAEIAEYVSQNEDLFYVNLERQKLNLPHQKTTFIGIYDYPGGDGMQFKELGFRGSLYDPVDLKLKALVDPIAQELATFHEGRIARVLIVRLPAGADIYDHIDGGEYLLSVRRNHIALKTNPDVLFTIAGEAKNMKVGECWEINNGKSHGLVNNGTTDRDHLIIDILPEELFSND